MTTASDAIAAAAVRISSSGIRDATPHREQPVAGLRADSVAAVAELDQPSLERVGTQVLLDHERALPAAVESAEPAGRAARGAPPCRCGSAGWTRSSANRIVAATSSGARPDVRLTPLRSALARHSSRAGRSRRLPTRSRRGSGVPGCARSGRRRSRDRADCPSAGDRRRQQQHRRPGVEGAGEHARSVSMHEAVSGSDHVDRHRTEWPPSGPSSKCCS